MAINVKINVTKDEIIAFFFTNDFLGAPGSFPNLTSLSRSIPNGNITKKTSHQRIK